jgi:uncharacterized protein YjiS (DUF1127 family)
MQCNTNRRRHRPDGWPQRFLHNVHVTRLSKIRAYLKYRETVRELSRLSDRELEDIGISRYQIGDIARTNYAA